jgi:hypothetical protein
MLISVIVNYSINSGEAIADVEASLRVDVPEAIGLVINRANPDNSEAFSAYNRVIELVQDSFPTWSIITLITVRGTFALSANALYAPPP